MAYKLAQFLFQFCVWERWQNITHKKLKYFSKNYTKFNNKNQYLDGVAPLVAHPPPLKLHQ